MFRTSAVIALDTVKHNGVFGNRKGPKADASQQTAQNL